MGMIGKSGETDWSLLIFLLPVQPTAEMSMQEDCQQGKGHGWKEESEEQVGEPQFEPARPRGRTPAWDM